MSPFERYVRESLGRLDSAWPGEWDRCLEEARPSLAALRRNGGDERFALFVLANYRWRHVVVLGPLKERDVLIEQIDQLLGNQSAWFHDVQQSGRNSWKAAEEELRRAKERLLSMRPYDLSAFESAHTDSMTAGARWESDHLYTCLWVLDWHLKQVPGVRRFRRRLLTDLLRPFGFFGLSSTPELVVIQRLRRNPRVHKGSRISRNLTLADLIRMYHSAHCAAGEGCGPLCAAWSEVFSFKPPTKAQRLTEKALSLERTGRHAEAARSYQAAVKEAERVLGRDHSYLAWILVRYWFALRHAGQHAKAAKIKPRAERMWEKYGVGHLSE